MPTPATSPQIPFPAALPVLLSSGYSPTISAVDPAYRQCSQGSTTPPGSRTPTGYVAQKSIEEQFLQKTHADARLSGRPESRVAQQPMMASGGQLLFREALNMGLCEDVLTRLQPGGTNKKFSGSLVVALREQCGITLVSQLFLFRDEQISQLQGVTDEEKQRLKQLCQSLRHEMGMSSDGQRQALPTKNTFIHFEETMLDLTDDANTAFSAKQVMQSAPPMMLERSFHTKWPEMEAKHFAGQCKPCAYFFKNETCRWGGQCSFCHLCPPGEIKARKKEKVKAMRAQDKPDQVYADSATPASRTPPQPGPQVVTPPAVTRNLRTPPQGYGGRTPPAQSGMRAPPFVVAPPLPMASSNYSLHSSNYSQYSDTGWQKTPPRSPLLKPSASDRLVSLWALS